MENVLPLGGPRRAPGKEYIEPEVVQAMHPTPQPAGAAAQHTDFTAWTDAEIIAFLDRRGEDHDDCSDRPALIARAEECEHNTGPAERNQPPAGGSADEEEDPLEAFMADNAAAAAAAQRAPATAGCDDEDAMDDYIAAHAARGRAPTAPAAAVTAAPLSRSGVASDDEEVYAAAAAAATPSDEPGPPSRHVDPLPPVNHAAISYPPFRRNFYDEPPDLFVLDDEEVAAARAALGIVVRGKDVPKPISEFDHAGFVKPLAAAVQAAGFAAPTAIQAQVLPVRTVSIFVRVPFV